jgi:hypothetical protein
MDSSSGFTIVGSLLHIATQLPNEQPSLGWVVRLLLSKRSLLLDTSLDTESFIEVDLVLFFLFRLENLS